MRAEFRTRSVMRQAARGTEMPGAAGVETYGRGRQRVADGRSR
jgi:hypothetical protein